MTFAREGVDIQDVMAIREAFDALDQDSNGRVEISKLKKDGYNEEFIQRLNNEAHSKNLTRERLDPFAVWDKGMKSDTDSLIRSRGKFLLTL